MASDANDIFSRFRDGHSIDNQCSVVALDRFGNAFPKLMLDMLVFPGAFPNEPFEPFLIHLHFVSDIGDGIGTSGA